jgi:hypothetical protein
MIVDLVMRVTSYFHCCEVMKDTKIAVVLVVG